MAFKGEPLTTLSLFTKEAHALYVQIMSMTLFLVPFPQRCARSSVLMSSTFEMSMMGKLTFFLGLQYYSKTYSYVPSYNLHADPDGKYVNPTYYRGMIGSLMYLTASHPDIMFAICLCARYQASPKESHLLAVKRIFKYLKGTHFGTLYPRDFIFDLVGYSDSDYVGCMLDRKAPVEDATVGGGGRAD
uniref:uncharacterized mitochondrial protein AtMg00810-like n=1 Tax=Erigeron canadensis TaxID=72917 RepID=UPI001CB92500|nr:uncharacterized mitochondrial protein AtMg00810-like [Erigeron canadensis]